MNIESKLKVSDESDVHIHWFREGRRLRLYQGGLLWLKEQGIPMRLECRVLASRGYERIVFGEFSEAYLLKTLGRKGLSPESTEWGICLRLPRPRCFASEKLWLHRRASELQAFRWGSEVDGLQDGNHLVKELLLELHHWPSAQLTPMHAMKAIRRWQVLLLQVMPKGCT